MSAISVDTSVEGVHFRRAWAPLDVLAARAFEAALSDLAAMGSAPRVALVALALPRTTTTREVTALGRGLARAARRERCPIVGGNVTRATEMAITTTVLGDADAPITRSGARIGNRVFVTGAVGAAAIGLALLERGDRQGPFVHRFLAPRARIDAGRALASLAYACIDLSDGLLADLGHVAAASEVAIELDAERLPLARGHRSACAHLHLDPIEIALTGGEDYELAFTASARARLPIRAHEIGRVVRGRGVSVLGHGRPLRAGFDHFAR